MANKFAVVGITGIVVCVACLGVAAALGGKALRDNGFNLGNLSKLGNLDLAACDVDDSGKSGSRSIAWNGDDKATVALSANVHYRRGSGDQVVVKGDSAVIAHVKVVDGTVKMDCRMDDDDSQLDVTLPGRDFQKFTLAGSGNMTLANIQQPHLKIVLAGSGDIQADGTADDLDVVLAGSGDAKLGALAANRIKLEIAGSSYAEVAARDDLDVHIAGSGKVTLKTEPHAVHTHIAGSGEIVHANGAPDIDKNI